MLRAGHRAGEGRSQGEDPYLSGLARRQVKKQSRPRASAKRRQLRTEVRTKSRVRDRRAILGQARPSEVAADPGHTQANWLWILASKPWVSGCHLALSPGLSLADQ